MDNTTDDRADSSYDTCRGERGCASLGLLEHGQDLPVGESGLFHGASSEKTTRKFHFWRQLTGGGITMLKEGREIARQSGALSAAQLQQFIEGSLAHG